MGSIEKRTVLKIGALPRGAAFLALVSCVEVACSAAYTSVGADGTDASATEAGNNGGADGASLNDVVQSPPDAPAPDASVVVDLGSGIDGAYAPAKSEVFTQTCLQRLRGVAGTSAITADNLDPKKMGLGPGTVLLLHQPQGMGAGSYELVTIGVTFPDAGGMAVSLTKPLKNSYGLGSGDPNHGDGQAIVVRQFTTVNVAAGLTVTAAPWNGTCGGVLAFKATGAVNIAGQIDLSGAGFRGYSHAATCAGGATFECSTANINAGTANGFSGESEIGHSLQNNVANGMGGGGGQDGADCGMGGGGGHAVVGVKGPNGTASGGCRMGTQLGGSGGTIAGVNGLSDAIFFGGAGGEGGGDEDGAYPGAGGNGGGVIWIDALSVSVTGALLANGAAGAAGVSNAPVCGGGGGGMGGGGGGAGGSIHVNVEATAALGTGLVSALGAAGGVCGGSLPSPPVGGKGGDGLIGVNATNVTGTTTPTFDPH